MTKPANPKSRPLHFAKIINGGVFLAVITLGGAIYFTPLKTWLTQGHLIKDQLVVFGVAAPWVFTASVTLLTAIGLPRLLLCSLGGVVFGFAWGLIFAQIGTVLGSYATFLFVRWSGRDYALCHFPRLRSFSKKLECQGLLSVLLIRQLPVSGFHNSVFLGLTRVNHHDFLLGSFLDFLPLSIPTCLVGAGLIQVNWQKGLEYMVLGLAYSVVFAAALSSLAKAKSAPSQ